MEDSTYETFEDELGKPLQEDPPAKPARQIRRTDMQASWKVKENVPKPAHKEVLKSMSIRRALSTQNPRQMETPWEGITLNRCLFVAITILLISSGFQRLHEALKGLRVKEDHERAEEGGKGAEHSLTLRHTGLKQERTQLQPESTLWDILFWWVLEDEDEENEEESTARKTRKTDMEMKGVHGGLERAKYWETLGSAGRKREKRKEKRRRGREQEEEDVAGKRGREKRDTVKQWVVEEEEEILRKKQKKSETQEKQKRSEFTE